MTRILPPEDYGPLDEAVTAAGSFDWIMFTSANAVDSFMGRLLAGPGDVRDLKGVKLAAVGPATAAAIEARGLRVDLVPEAYVAESLVDALGASGRLDGTRVLLARAAVARDVLPDSLRAAGASVDVVEAYRTARPEGSAELLTLLVDSGGLDLATFTSSSTVTNFVALVGAARAHGIRAACIGPVTAATARDAGMTVAVEATEFTVTGLVDAIVRHRSNPN
jgi:uroporphyrinogen III methyltransferase/synthase